MILRDKERETGLEIYLRRLAFSCSKLWVDPYKAQPCTWFFWNRENSVLNIKVAFVVWFLKGFCCCSDPTAAASNLLPLISERANEYFIKITSALNSHSSSARAERASGFLTLNSSSPVVLSWCSREALHSSLIASSRSLNLWWLLNKFRTLQILIKLLQTDAVRLVDKPKPKSSRDHQTLVSQRWSVLKFSLQ